MSSKSLRLSEKWFRRGLWLIAFVFGSFLIGLGSTVVGDLPKIEHRARLDDFIDAVTADPLRKTIADARANEQRIRQEGEQTALQLQAARQASRASRDTFSNWIATRHATARPDQDSELIARTKALDDLKKNENEVEGTLGRQRQAALDSRQAREQAQIRPGEIEVQAQKRLDAKNHRLELRVFGLRLALTLPLLVIGGWLLAKKRQSTWWPFVWGFVYFALFAFFVELVPYLPSYGGYVRYVVGIVVTVLVGRYAIIALNRYPARQKLAEAQPETMRRQELSYDTALARLAKSVCPGCERPVDLKGNMIDFCPHCGIGLFDHCHNCKTRKSAFAQFCHACGTPAASTPTSC